MKDVLLDPFMIVGYFAILLGIGGYVFAYYTGFIGHYHEKSEKKKKQLTHK